VVVVVVVLETLELQTVKVGPVAVEMQLPLEAALAL
jgi:hypothetical protein